MKPVEKSKPLPNPVYVKVLLFHTDLRSFVYNNDNLYKTNQTMDIPRPLSVNHLLTPFFSYFYFTHKVDPK